MDIKKILMGDRKALSPEELKNYGDGDLVDAMVSSLSLHTSRYRSIQQELNRRGKERDKYLSELKKEPKPDK